MLLRKRRTSALFRPVRSRGRRGAFIDDSPWRGETRGMALKITGETSIQLSDYLAVLARRKLVLFVSVVVGIALALGYSYGIAQPAYASQASVLVNPVLDRPFNPGTGGIDKALNMGTEKTLATSTAVAQIVKDTLKLPDDV